MMLCKLLSCAAVATERRITPFGTANLCAGHAINLDKWEGPERELGGPDSARYVLNNLSKAFRYGPHEDPPLSQDSRGQEYAHPRTGAE